jgi:hypothetical protein
MTAMHPTGLQLQPDLPLQARSCRMACVATVHGGTPVGMFIRRGRAEVCGERAVGARSPNPWVVCSLVLTPCRFRYVRYAE